MIYRIHTTRNNANTEVLEICKEIRSINPTGSLVFDFSDYEETNPFSNLLLVNTLRNKRASYPDVKMKCTPKPYDNYLFHMGFYKACGITTENTASIVPSNKYVPIKELELYGSTNAHKLIGQYAEELAATIQFDASLQDMLGYLFYETIRNVFEHADIGNVLVSAQYWPSKQIVEIAIADAGCGVQASLGKVFVLDELELLKHSCKPGITARSNYSYLDQYDPNRNSGYGLFNMKELALAYGGYFMICSGNYALRYSRKLGDSYYNDIEEVFKTAYSGTVICLRFRTDLNIDFQKVLDGSTKKGELLSAQIEGAIRSASKSASGRYKMEPFVRK